MVFPERIFEHWQAQFLAALEACRKRPRPNDVHALRTSARRLEALLEEARRRRPNDAKFVRKINRALEALKPVRSAAGPVRDKDVQRELLKGLVEEVAGKELDAELRAIEKKVKRQRKDATVSLADVIAPFKEREVRRLSTLKQELDGWEWKLLLNDAREIERRYRAKLEAGNSESLHSFRKGAKFARYLAEMDEGSSASARFAERLKNVLDAIGGWHDWMLLEAVAGKTLGKSASLAGRLKKNKERSLRAALTLLRTLT